MSGSKDVSLTIFITSVSGSENLTSFVNRFSHFSGLPGFRMAFDAAKGNRKFDRIQCQKKETSIPLQKNSESRSKMQSHPSEISEN